MSRRNLCINPTAAVDLLRWATASTVTTWERVALPTATGLPSGVSIGHGFHLVVPGSGGRAVIGFSVVSGIIYTLSSYFLVPSGIANWRVRITSDKTTSPDFQMDGNFVGSISSFQRSSVTFTATETGTWYLNCRQSSGAGSEAYFVACLAEQGPDLNSYFDGGMRGYHWAGTANDSISIENTHGQASMSASGLVSVSGRRRRRGSASLAAVGSAAVTGRRVRHASATLSGSGSMSVRGRRFGAAKPQVGDRNTVKAFTQTKDTQ